MSLSSNCLLERLSGTLPQVVGKAVASGRAVRADDLAGLDLLLDAAQVVGELGREIPPGQLLYERAEVSRRRVVKELDDQLRPAIAGRSGQAHGRTALLERPPQLRRRGLDVLAGPV